MHPKLVADQSVMAVLSVLVQAGYPVLLPFGENTRFDLALEEVDGVARVQVKTGRLRDGAIRFNACSSHAHHPNPKGAVRRAYLGQVEYFGVFCPETAGVYLVPIEAAQLRRQGALRVVAPRNGQRAGIRFAAEYLIGTWRVGVAEAQVRATPARAGPGPRAPRRREG